MATQLISAKTIQESMDSYQPIYAPLFSLFLAGKTQQYAETEGTVNFNTVEAMGNIRQHKLLSKDTVMRQFAAGPSNKGFKKYFHGVQFVTSQLQDQTGVDGIVDQALEEHNKQFDDLLMLGEGTSAGTVVNNGLYWSGDSNYILNSSATIAKATDGTWVASMYANILATLTQSKLSGRKVLIVYGPNAIANYNGLFATAPSTLNAVIAPVLEKNNTSVVLLPSEVTPAGVDGWILASMDFVKMHYTAVPKLDDSGVNSEKKYNWFNFLMGSVMLEVQGMGGIIRQPVTFAA